MSETTTPVVPPVSSPDATTIPVPDSTQSAGDAGPASATPPVVASESAAPAASSSEAVTAATDAVVEPASTEEAGQVEAKPSLLSEATGEKKPDEPAAAEGEKPTEAPVEVAAPTYEPFALPEGVKLDDGKLTEFSGVLGEFEQKVAKDPAQAHAAAQEFGQKLLDMYVSESRAAADRFTKMQSENWQRLQEDWLSEFRNDPDIGKNRQNTSLARMGGLMDLYGQTAGPERLGKLRDVLTLTGAGNNPEVLRFVNWAASRLTEMPRIVVPMQQRAPIRTSPAQRLYKNSPGAA